MPVLGAQRGHYPRVTGATGTEGEQAMTFDVCTWLERLRPPGWTVRLLDADIFDERLLRCDVLVCVHGDGSENAAASGASVGYPTPEGAAYAQRWKEAYAAAGWPFGFHPDNYTAGLRGYYLWDNCLRQGTRACFLVEAGMMTNHSKDRPWIDQNHVLVAHAIWVAVAGMSALGGGQMHLQVGSTGDIVGELQERLRITGADVRPSGNVFDARTEQLVKNFQSSAGLPETGVVDQRTWDKLVEVTTAPPAPTHVCQVPADYSALKTKAALVDDFIKSVSAVKVVS